MHQITYKNAPSDWDEALPIGNGHFGAMIYQDQSRLVCASNHYDVHYKKRYMYSKKYHYEKLAEQTGQSVRESQIDYFKNLKKEALRVHENKDDPAYSYYTALMNPYMREGYGVDRQGAANPVSGEIIYRFCDEMAQAENFESRLDIEEGAHSFAAELGSRRLDMRTVIPREKDAVITEIAQRGNMISKIILSLPIHYGSDILCEYRKINENTVCFVASFFPDGDKGTYNPFYFIHALHVDGCKSLSAEAGENCAAIYVSGDNFNVISCVVTELGMENTTDDKTEKDVAKWLVGRASDIIAGCVDNMDTLIGGHKDYWRGFFDKSGICLPDKMLENLWYFNLYALSCCNGEGAVLYEQACGLNGLWDIMQPTQWGSLWYWDVNIQQAFWPIYTANHLEMGRPFYDGLLSYVDEAKKHSERVYGMAGIASDYPHIFYMCIWPWCAQFFDMHYKFSGDTDFLKEKAYPLYCGILEFYEQYLDYDPSLGKYSIFPDISPEQGPLTRDSAITVSCLKKLLVCAIEAGGVLGENPEKIGKWEDIYGKLPAYAIGETEKHGKFIKDSPWVENDQYLAHGSVLMPIYPIGEFNRLSPPEVWQIARNTIKYADEKLCFSTHAFAWEAAALARLGLGADAARCLYEKGIHFAMRANGFFAEETDRWIQHCLVACPPVYNPPLVEGGSATVAAVNEMLLQSANGIMQVFPAVPDGRFSLDGEGKNKLDKVYKKDGNIRRDIHRDFNWDECSFTGLLAEGGFEVSAWYKNGCARIEIFSKLGKTAKISNPFKDDNFTIESINGSMPKHIVANNVISFETEAKMTYVLSVPGKPCSAANETHDSLHVYVSPSGRRVFLGKDADTSYYRALDDFVHDYYQADAPSSRVTLYKLDFTVPEKMKMKDYRKVLMPQYHACGKMGLAFRCLSVSNLYSPRSEFGWKQNGSLIYFDSNENMPDPLRRDGIGSRETCTLCVHLAKGKYALLVVSGSPDKETMTILRVGNSAFAPPKAQKAGCFDVSVVLFDHDKNGPAEIEFSAADQVGWQVCALMINNLL